MVRGNESGMALRLSWTFVGQSAPENVAWTLVASGDCGDASATLHHSSPGEANDETQGFTLAGGSIAAPGLRRSRAGAVPG